MIAFLWFFTVVRGVLWAGPAAAGVGPSVREVIEFTRIIQPVLLDDQTLREQRSPDGQRAFIVTRRGDVATDTNRFEILLLDVSARRLQSAAARSRARTVATAAAIRASLDSSFDSSFDSAADATSSEVAARRAPPDAGPSLDATAPVRLLSVQARDDENDATPAVKDVRWAGNGTLLYRARLNDAPYQAFKLDVATRQVTQLTNSPHGVLAFDASADLRRLVYIAPVPNPPMPADARSIVVGTQSFWTVHFGQHKFGNQQRRYQFFVTDVAAQEDAGAHRVAASASGVDSGRAARGGDGRGTGSARAGAPLTARVGARVSAAGASSSSQSPMSTEANKDGARQVAWPLGEPFAEANLGVPTASISPDGRWALVPRYEAHRQLQWSRQYPYVADVMATYGASLTMDPLSYFSRPSSYVTRRLVAYRLSDRREHPVLDAPDDAKQDTQGRAHGLWQEGGKSVVIAGTFLPQRPGAAPIDSASHVVEFWPDTGVWRDIATLRVRAKSSYAVPAAVGHFSGQSAGQSVGRSAGQSAGPSAGRFAGQSAGIVVVDGDRARRFERAGANRWREVAADASADERGGPKAAAAAPMGWDLRVHQTLNQPPDIVATGPNGRSVRLTALNPQYAASRWGTMREYGWTDAVGRSWKGGLMVPAGFDPKVRHALVIQAYGFSPTRFYRDGSNLYDGFTSGFPGRAFLAENILVLALPIGPAGGGPQDERGHRIAFAQGVRAAVDALVADGMVDRDRIGLMGWSATGESVLNLVTFTDIPIRAASLLDGDANTLFSLTVTYAATDGIQMKKEEANQGGPFGGTRERWLANDPSLHTECVRAATRIETYGREVHNNWDIYALLRRQYKPVEMVLFPEGAHALARPSERMISLQGNVDWYRFWLKGEKRSEVRIPRETAATLRQQYERWDQMLALKRADDARPACAVRKDLGGELTGPFLGASTGPNTAAAVGSPDDTFASASLADHTGSWTQ